MIIDLGFRLFLLVASSDPLKWLRVALDGGRKKLLMTTRLTRSTI